MTISIPRIIWPFWDHELLMFSFSWFTMPTWHGNCFVSLSKWDWNCMVKQFWHWIFGLFDVVFGWHQSNPLWFCVLYWDDSSLIQFDLILIFLLIGHFQFGMEYFFVSLSKWDWNCGGKQFQFELWFDLFDFIFG